MIIFNVVNKKNNKILISDAGREIQTLRSTDNVENSVNFSGSISLPLGWDYKYLSCVYGVDRKICHKGH